MSDPSPLPAPQLAAPSPTQRLLASLPPLRGRGIAAPGGRRFPGPRRGSLWWGGWGGGGEGGGGGVGGGGVEGGGVGGGWGFKFSAELKVKPLTVTVIRIK